MNKLFFRLLVFLMSLSLIGIILVQMYWFNTSFQNNDEQFKFHVKQVMGNVADKLQKQEAYTLLKRYDQLKDSIGKSPKTSDLLQFYYVQKNAVTKQTIVYSNSLIAEDYDVSSTFFNKNAGNKNIKTYSSKRKTEIFNGNTIDNSSPTNNVSPDVKIEKSGTLDILQSAQFEIAFKDIKAAMPIEQRVTVAELHNKLEHELNDYGVKTCFEFGIFSNGKATAIKSDKFKYKKDKTYSIPIFVDSDGNNKYQLLVTFPYKTNYLFSELMAISILSIIFTLIIIIAYSSAINQLIKQRQISEIKTDFINNMTHEFKTPIATINLALDAIKNPKVIENDS
jgi:two-component system, OmpR family, phosphate regulon sensor histidine kinase PhoR